MATDMECCLFQVCKEGNLDELRTRCKANSSILNQKIPGLPETPLHLATRFNHNELVREILSRGKHTAEAINGEEETPLHVACRLGFLDIVNQLLPACSCVPYKRNRDGQCALFLACLCEHLDVALILCDSMDFGAWDVIGASCLWIAASKGYEGVVVKILDKNPSLAWSKDEDGFSAMHLAAREGKIEVIKKLLQRNIDLSLLRENNGRTPLQLAAVSRKEAAVKVFLPESTLYNTLQVLITDLINIADNDGNTILHHAATVNFSEILKILVRVQGMNVNAVNKRGMTALDILEQQPVSTQRNNIIQQLGAALGTNPISVEPRSKQGSPVSTEQGAPHGGVEEREIPAPSSAPCLDQTRDLPQVTPGDQPGGAQVTPTPGDQPRDQPGGAQVTPGDQPGAAQVTPGDQTGAAHSISVTPGDQTGAAQVTPGDQTGGAHSISVTPVQETLMVVAALVCTITFQAGLNPPGGFWQDSNGTNQTDHKAGKAIQNTTNPWLHMAFTVFNAMAFTTALALIPTIIILPEKTMTYVNSLVVLALLCLEVTFILGLIMVSDGELYIIGEIGAPLLPLLFFLCILGKGLNRSCH